MNIRAEFCGKTPTTRRLYAALLALSFISACGQSAPNDGVGDVKYGMTTAQLMQLGFSCQPDKCTREQLRGQPSVYPIVKPDSVQANLIKDTVTSIDLHFLLYSPDETISAYTKAYGHDYVCRFRNAIFATIEDHVWTSKDGATVTISKILDYGALQRLGALMPQTSSATYRDASENKSFRAGRC